MDAKLLSSPAFWQSQQSYGFEEGGCGGIADDRLLGKVCFFTSGSTGAPKGVVLSKEALLLSARAVNEHLQVERNSCWGLVLPLKHVGGFGVVARAYQAGCRVVMDQGRWQVERFCQWLADERVTHTSLVPTQVHDLVRSANRAPSGLRAVVVGGGRLEREMGQAARDLGWPVLASYGMTETGSQVATQGLEELANDYRVEFLPILPIWRVRLAENGNLEVAGDGLFSGMLAREAGGWCYQERSSDWYATQDRVQIEDGKILPIGRSDSLVKVLGELVSVEDVERQLLAVSKGRLRVGEVVVVAIPDARLQHALVPVFISELDRSMVEGVLAAYHAVAKGYERLASPRWLEAWPVSELGKVQREQIRKRVLTTSG